LPDSADHLEQELTLQLALNNALVTVKGFTAPEVKKTVLRARELSQQLGETPQLFPVLYSLWAFYFLGRELQKARELAEQMLHLAQSVQDPFLLSRAHLASGWTLYDFGEPALARTHAEQALALYGLQRPPRSTITALDLRVDCLSYTTWTLWLLGYPDQALKRSQEAVDLAKGLSHFFSLAYALGSAALLHSFRREGQLARERAEMVMTLATEQGFPYWLAFGTMVQGWALVEQGRVQEGIVRMRQMRAPFTFALLAEAYGKLEQVEEGLAVLAEALVFVDKTGVRVSEAELHRLKGELTLQQFKVQSSKFKVEESPESEAEGCFLRAIEIARKQQAKSLELRATMSLVRLRQQQASEHGVGSTEQRAGNREQGTRVRLDEARHMLSEIYNWFTEGFDTKDLQEAKALLDSLASSI
jgi:predicted ATPase